MRKNTIFSDTLQIHQPFFSFYGSFILVNVPVDVPVDVIVPVNVDHGDKGKKRQPLMELPLNLVVK